MKTKIFIFIFCISACFFAGNSSAQTAGSVNQFGFLVDSVGQNVLVQRDSMEYYMVMLLDGELNSETCAAIDKEAALINEQHHSNAGVSVRKNGKEIAYRPSNNKTWIIEKSPKIQKNKK